MSDSTVTDDMIDVFITAKWGEEWKVLLGAGLDIYIKNTRAQLEKCISSMSPVTITESDMEFQADGWFMRAEDVRRIINRAVYRCIIIAEHMEDKTS